MINIIFCDDNKEIRELVLKIIKNTIEDLNVKCNYLEFDNYNSSFFDTINLQNKIYILDIQTPSMSGIVAAEIIRRTDACCKIIFLTGYQSKHCNELLSSEIEFSKVIQKYDYDMEAKLKNILKKQINSINKIDKLIFNDKNNYFTLSISKILYITTNKNKTMIVCDNHNYLTELTIKELESLLPNCFEKIHRCMIINLKRRVQSDYSHGITTFDTGETVSLMSRKFRKEHRI